MAKTWRADAATMAAIVMALCIVTIALGERIGLNRGQGQDGMSYTLWAQDFWRNVIVEGLTTYHSQRIFPSAIVHYSLRLVGQAPTASHVIAGFQVLQTSALTLSAVLWAHLGHAMKWRRASIWVGFVALFGCFANARHALYYPTLTDPPAFLLGLAMVWAYLTERPVVLWIVAAIGVVTWPALPPIALALLVLPRAAEPVAETTWKYARWIAAAVAAVAAATFLLIARYYYLHPVPDVGDEKFARWVRGDLLVITVPTLAVMLGVGWYLLLREPRVWNVRGYWRGLRRRRTLIAAGSVAVLLGLRAIWLTVVGVYSGGPTGAQFICEHTLAAIRGPLWGLVFHVVYFGPIILVALIYWRRIASIAASWGPSAVLAIAITVAFAGGSNSRQWNHLFPMLVAITIAATNDLWTPRRALAFAAVALPWSKLWLHIGYDKQLAFREFPNQRYFMNTGPYASDTTYLVQLGAALVTALVLVLLLRSKPTDDAERTIPH